MVRLRSVKVDAAGLVLDQDLRRGNPRIQRLHRPVIEVNGLLVLDEPLEVRDTQHLTEKRIPELVALAPFGARLRQPVRDKLLHTILGNHDKDIVSNPPFTEPSQA